MTRNLIYEMAVQAEADVFNMEPVASVTTEVTDTLEGEELRKYVFQMIQPKITNPRFTVTEQDIGILIRHHCGHRHLKKAALLALPYIINANIVTAKWDKNVKLDDDGNPIEDGDRRKSGMISAPILIDDVKYLCNLTNKKNGRRKVTPYALVLKDENGNLVEWEKMDSAPYSVPHSSSKPTAIGDAHSFKATTSHDTNPSFQGAKVQQNIETTKDNNIKTENYTYMKKLIRLTESDLHRVVKESVDKILKEMDLNPRMSTHDAYGRGLSRKSEGTNWSRQRRRPMTQQQNLGGVNMDAVNKVLFPDETPQMAKDQLKRTAQNALMNPPSVKESNLHSIVKESVSKIINESLYQDSYDWTLSTLDRRLKKHSIEDVVSFAKQELQFMDNMVHRMNGQDKGQYDAYRDFVLKYQN